MFILYNLLLLLASPVILPTLLAKKRCRPGLRQRLGWLPRDLVESRDGRPTIWVPRDADRVQLESKRVEVETALNKLGDEADHAVEDVTC